MLFAPVKTILDLSPLLLAHGKNVLSSSPRQLLATVKNLQANCKQNLGVKIEEHFQASRRIKRRGC